MDAHKDVRRKSGEPYIIHPIEVATICAREIGLGTKSIIAALLHDVVEDTPITLEEIEEQFGHKIAEIIDGLTKVSGIMGKSTSEQAENFKKILLTLSDDVRVILVKLADRLHNMRTLDALPQNKQLKIASETSFLFAPLAHRLGLHAIKSELEDLAMKYIEPKTYQDIFEKIESSKAQRARIIRKFVAPIEARLQETDMKFMIKGRLKSIYSISQKMKKQGIDFDKVYDVFAIRIIIQTARTHELEKADCWRSYSLVTDVYTPNPSRLRDWISTPKANGYESLHTTVMGPGGRWFEVQIRTERMDDVAEKGFAAHWKYKAGENSSGVGLEEWLNKIRELLENSESEALDFLDDFKLNLFSEEIFAFTPRGDLVTLPTGATALDFAFEIHTDIGSHCIGAKVNQKIAPLSYVIKNGDQIEIITSKSQKPNEGWLDFVVSAKAKSKIKSSIKEEKRKVFLQGKEYLKLKLDRTKSGFDNYMLTKLAKHFSSSSTIELYYQIGTEKIDKKTLTKAIKLIEDGRKKGHKAQPTKKKANKEPGNNAAANNSDVLLIGDTDIGMEYQFARCCNPIPGDNIFGFITVQDGIKIHRTSCSNAPALLTKYGYRILRAKWGIPEIEDIKYRPAGIKVVGIDSPGIVSAVSEIIFNELKVNMKSISFEAVDGAYKGAIVVEMMDTAHLEELIKKLRQVIGVEVVHRFEVNEELKSTR